MPCCIALRLAVPVIDVKRSKKIKKNVKKSLKRGQNKKPFKNVD